MSKNTILTIYHSADMDGQASREVAKATLGDTADYLGWDYGQDIPDLSEYSLVYLIDISFPYEVMKKYTDRLIWIDHHKSAIDTMKDLDLVGYRIDGVAACRLAYQWFESTTDSPDVEALGKKEDYVNRVVTEPYAIQLLGEYDIWDKRNPDVDQFQLGLQAQSNPDWESLLVVSDSYDESYADRLCSLIIEAGQTIETYMKIQNASIITTRGFDITFEGLKFRALNIARCNSMTFEAALTEEHDGCLAYYWNGSKWRFSLYHAVGKEHHDLSLIAVKFGGGGHRGACGFELDVLPKGLGGNDITFGNN